MFPKEEKVIQYNWLEIKPYVIYDKLNIHKNQRNYIKQNTFIKDNFLDNLIKQSELLKNLDEMFDKYNTNKSNYIFSFHNVNWNKNSNDLLSLISLIFQKYKFKKNDVYCEYMNNVKYYIVNKTSLLFWSDETRKQFLLITKKKNNIFFKKISKEQSILDNNNFSFTYDQLNVLNKFLSS